MKRILSVVEIFFRIYKVSLVEVLWWKAERYGVTCNHFPGNALNRGRGSL